MSWIKIIILNVKHTLSSSIFLTNRKNHHSLSRQIYRSFPPLFHFESIRPVTSRYPSYRSHPHLARAKSISREQYPCTSHPLFHTIRSKDSSGGNKAKRCLVFEERENTKTEGEISLLAGVEVRFHGGLSSSRELSLNEDLEVGGASRIRN